MGVTVSVPRGELDDETERETVGETEGEIESVGVHEPVDVTDMV